MPFFVVYFGKCFIAVSDGEWYNSLQKLEIHLLKLSFNDVKNSAALHSRGWIKREKFADRLLTKRLSKSNKILKFSQNHSSISGMQSNVLAPWTLKDRMLNTINNRQVTRHYLQGVVNNTSRRQWVNSGGNKRIQCCRSMSGWIKEYPTIHKM